MNTCLINSDPELSPGLTDPRAAIVFRFLEISRKYFSLHITQLAGPRGL